MAQEFNKANIDQLINMLSFLQTGGQNKKFEGMAAIDPTNFPKVDTSALQGLLSPDTGTLPLAGTSVGLGGGTLKDQNQIKQLYNLINSQLYSIGR